MNYSNVLNKSQYPMTEITSKNWGSQLSAYLEENGHNVRWLSRLTGIKYPRLYYIVRQKVEPTVGEAVAICDALGVPFEKFLTEEMEEVADA